MLGLFFVCISLDYGMVFDIVGIGVVDLVSMCVVVCMVW